MMFILNLLRNHNITIRWLFFAILINRIKAAVILCFKEAYLNGESIVRDMLLSGNNTTLLFEFDIMVSAAHAAQHFDDGVLEKLQIWIDEVITAGIGIFGSTTHQTFIVCI